MHYKRNARHKIKNQTIRNDSSGRLFDITISTPTIFTYIIYTFAYNIDIKDITINIMLMLARCLLSGGDKGAPKTNDK